MLWGGGGLLLSFGNIHKSIVTMLGENWILIVVSQPLTKDQIPAWFNSIYGSSHCVDLISFIWFQSKKCFGAMTNTRSWPGSVKSGEHTWVSFVHETFQQILPQAPTKQMKTDQRKKIFSFFLLIFCFHKSADTLSTTNHPCSIWILKNLFFV